MSDVSSISSSSSTPTAMTGAGGGDKIRILGMNTGLDVDGIVKKMLKIDQTRVDDEDKKLQKLQWKQEAYQDIIASVKDLQDSYFNLTNLSSMVTRGDNYNVYKATSGDETIATATASSDAIEGIYTIKVVKTATKAIIGSTSSLTDVKPDISSTTKLSDLNISTADKLTIKVDDKDTYDITFSDSDETIGGFLKKVNEQTKGTVSGYYDDTSNKIVLQRSSTGVSQSIQVMDTNMSEKFKLTNGSVSEKTTGSDADVFVTSPLGGNKEIQSETNDIDINGVTFNLEGKQSSDGTLANAVSTTITVKPDIDTTFNLIKGFIDKYNALVDKVQTKLTEEPDKDSTGRFQTYEPLTDAQKASMTTDQINKWEAKAKVGIVANDDTLTTMMDSIREAFFDKINDVSIGFGKHIGLDVVDEYKKGGRIEFTDDDGEQKLKDVITNNRNQIMELFTKTSTSTDKTDKYNNEGIFQRINDILQNYVGRTGTYLNDGILTSLANKQNDHSTTGSGIGDSIPDQIYRESLSIKDLQDKMSSDSEKYYNEFSKLEVAMEQLNSQSSWLSQMTSQ